MSNNKIEEFNVAQLQCVNLAKDLRVALQDMNNLKRAGGYDATKASRIRSEISELSRMISSLDDILKSMKGSTYITPNDIRRREGLVVDIRNNYQELLQMEKGNSIGAASLQDYNKPKQRKKGSETDETRGLSNESLLQHQQETMSKQDELIGLLVTGVDSLKKKAEIIGNEADLHKRLLDDIEDDVERGERALDKETDKTKKVGKKSDMCSLYVCICLLIIVVVVLVVLKLQ